MWSFDLVMLQKHVDETLLESEDLAAVKVLLTNETLTQEFCRRVLRGLLADLALKTKIADVETKVGKYSERQPKELKLTLHSFLTGRGTSKVEEGQMSKNLDADHIFIIARDKFRKLFKDRKKIGNYKPDPAWHELTKTMGVVDQENWQLVVNKVHTNEC